MNNPKALLDRRRFLAGISAAVAAPAAVPTSALGLVGDVAPSNRITMGLIGCGGHGAGWNLDRMLENPHQQVVAVCDVDAQHAAHAERKVNAHYSQNLNRNYRCDVHQDFRDLINRKDVDAVAVATPDHWHVLPALMAIKSGKHVICEKPLSLTVYEGRILADASANSGVIFQTASENRSIDSYLRICELVHAGAIGELRHITVHLPGGNDPRGNDDFAVVDPPPHLNYEMWQGQAPTAPYCRARVHNTFRWNLAYSGGRLTDWGAHLIDLAQWASGHQQTGPVEVEGSGRFPPRGAVWNTASEFDVQFRYANGLTMRVISETPGIKFEGTDGWVMSRGWRGPLKASDARILEFVVNAAKRLHRPKTLVTRESGSTGGEHLDFTECIKHGGPTYAPAEIGHRTTTVSHLGNIAMQLGRRLQWDPTHERFTNDAEANTMLSRKQREPWTIQNVDRWLNVG